MGSSRVLGIPGRMNTKVSLFKALLGWCPIDTIFGWKIILIGMKWVTRCLEEYELYCILNHRLIQWFKVPPSYLKCTRTIVWTAIANRPHLFAIIFRTCWFLQFVIYFNMLEWQIIIKWLNSQFPIGLSFRDKWFYHGIAYFLF